MSTKVHCYVRTHRRRWGLTQAQVANLLPGGGRNRVSRVERDKTPPNAAEILAYKLIFGSSCRFLFPRFHEEIEDAVMRSAYELHKAMIGDGSERAANLRKFIEQMFARATRKPNHGKP
ncbi:MAG TPA: hypothetical protein VKT78_16640 [Fimbriimonadaceae bacterium]|nr:hypothetical protein [Fimbriimonadaceae bacterium]